MQHLIRLRPRLRRPLSVRIIPVLIGVAAGALVTGSIVFAAGYPKNSIGSIHILDNSLRSHDIRDRAIGTVDIGVGGVRSTNILNRGIEEIDLKPGAVTSSRLRDNGVRAADIAADAVGHSELASGAVRAQEIATNAVGAGEIAADAVRAAEIATSAVGALEIESNAVGAAEIAAGAVGVSEIAAGSVLPAKFGAIPAARAERSTDLATASDTLVSLAMEEEVFDIGGVWSVADPERMTAPIDGVYHVTVGYRFVGNLVGDRSVTLYKGAATPANAIAGSTTRTSSSPIDSAGSVSTLIALDADEFVQARVMQSSGGGLDVVPAGETHFAMYWVAPG